MQEMEDPMTAAYSTNIEDRIASPVKTWLKIEPTGEYIILILNITGLNHRFYTVQIN